MSNLSELDLQNLRHLITGYETCGEKMSCYAKEATDPEVKKFFEDGVNSATQNKEKLMKFFCIFFLLNCLYKYYFKRK